MRCPDLELVCQIGRQLEINPLAPGLPEILRRAGTRQVGDFVGSILLPDGDPRLDPCELTNREKTRVVERIRGRFGLVA